MLSERRRSVPRLPAGASLLRRCLGGREGRERMRLGRKSRRASPAELAPLSVSVRRAPSVRWPKHREGLRCPDAATDLGGLRRQSQRPEPRFTALIIRQPRETDNSGEKKLLRAGRYPGSVALASESAWTATCGSDPQRPAYRRERSPSSCLTTIGGSAFPAAAATTLIRHPRETYNAGAVR